MSNGQADHWNAAYEAKGETGVSRFEAMPEVSLALVEAFGHGAETRLIDIGSGASRLVDVLIARGWTSLSVLDLSQAAVDAAKVRLGDAVLHAAPHPVLRTTLSPLEAGRGKMVGRRSNSTNLHRRA